MKAIYILIFGIFLFSITQLHAQEQSNLNIMLLANDKIGDINIEKEVFINKLQSSMNIIKKEFEKEPKSQKVACLIVFHKASKPTIHLYTKPSINQKRQEGILIEIEKNAQMFTKFMDFPIAITQNINGMEITQDFPEIFDFLDRPMKDYQNASLEQMTTLNKNWAINEILPVLNAYQLMVDDKFLGVKNFGKLVSTTNFSQKQDVNTLTNKNPDYWRACMEMNAGNQLITTTKIFMLVSQGNLDYARKYLEILVLFSSPESVAHTYLKQLSNRIGIFEEKLKTEIDKGIVLHDKGKYKEALEVYKSILTSYPYSSWGWYEVYYSQNALDIAEKKIEMGDAANWNKMKSKVYDPNPLYYMDVHASNAKEAYLLFRRSELKTLWKDKNEQMNDIYKYANIAMDLGVYDFAAQMFWTSLVHNKNIEKDKSLHRFLYCVEKLGVKDMRKIFDLDYDKAFKAIDSEKEQEMKNSIIYQSFKD